VSCLVLFVGSLDKRLAGKTTVISFPYEDHIRVIYWNGFILAIPNTTFSTFSF